ncbi:unnamed protein product [Phaedon cochleariae]|uniref:Uncharacterized protein n=1 Tax=Phaedon cochleariae TaxID=80249 RepID=A0A9N9SBA6_PHACE|nr:unnamed protein product [Phaedon cochleariae]
MLPKMGIERCKLLYMETDSFIYELKCDDAYEEVMKADLSQFDTSEYAPDNKYNMPLVNKKKLGSLKDEANGKIVTNFVGLRSKMYAYKVQNFRVQRTIRSYAHNVFSIQQSKIALSPKDDKRYLILGSFNTLPWVIHRQKSNFFM